MRKRKTKQKPIKMWIIAIGLGLLILVSGIQAVELVNLKNKIDTELNDLAISKRSVTTESISTLQKNLQNLPTMVGGC